MGVTITIVRNPAGDAGFEEAVNDGMRDGTTSPALLEGRLRERYPRAVVRPRDLAGESTTVWYVYRDGYWVPR